MFQIDLYPGWSGPQSSYLGSPQSWNDRLVPIFWAVLLVEMGVVANFLSGAGLEPQSSGSPHHELLGLQALVTAPDSSFFFLKSVLLCSYYFSNIPMIVFPMTVFSFPSFSNFISHFIISYEQYISDLVV
jgi:hypothetical protein